MLGRGCWKYQYEHQTYCVQTELFCVDHLGLIINTDSTGVLHTRSRTCRDQPVHVRINDRKHEVDYESRFL